jgi:DNA-binding NarL/FixJ family response regulator
MRIGLLEDDHAVRAAAMVILERGGHEPVPFENAAALLAASSDGSCPAVVLCDLDLGTESAIDVAPEVLERAPATVLVALTGHAGDAWVFAALAAGFTGYVLKSEAFDALCAVVDEVAAGGAPLSRDVARRVVGRFRTSAASAAPPSAPSAPPPSGLSPREIEVLQLLADGYRYEQVALHLDISLASVRTYVRRLYAKLGANTKSEATAIALRAKLIV